MDTSPSSVASVPSGSAAASVEPSASSTLTPSDTDAAEVAAVPTTPSDTEPEEFEYEFSNYFEGKLYFVHVYDNSIASAVERVIGRIQEMPVVMNTVTGNWFFEDKEGTGRWCIKVNPVKRSFTLDTDCKPLPEELTKRKPTVKVDSVLEGLI